MSDASDPVGKDAANMLASAQIAVYPISLSGVDTGGVGGE
jgi:hypothetical protein